MKRVGVIDQEEIMKNKEKDNRESERGRRIVRHEEVLNKTDEEGKI